MCGSQGVVFILLETAAAAEEGNLSLKKHCSDIEFPNVFIWFRTEKCGLVYVIGRRRVCSLRLFSSKQWGEPFLEGKQKEHTHTNTRVRESAQNTQNCGGAKTRRYWVCSTFQQPRRSRFLKGNCLMGKAAESGEGVGGFVVVVVVESLGRSHVGQVVAGTFFGFGETFVERRHVDGGIE